MARVKIAPVTLAADPLDFWMIEKELATGEPATFSCNEYGEAWPFVTWGYTPFEKRVYVQGRSPLLDKVVTAFLDRRPTGGRFRLYPEMACFADSRVPFVIFAS